MTSFELVTTRSGVYTFVDTLVVHVDGVRFGRGGTSSEKGLVSGEIRSLLKKIVRQQQFPEFLDFLSPKKRHELFSIFNEGCWGNGHWKYGQVGAPSDPFMFLALPAATELFDLERAYLVESATGLSRIVYRDIDDGLIKEVEVRTSEYEETWKSILAQIDSS
jgi:hypothetical protein